MRYVTLHHHQQATSMTDATALGMGGIRHAGSSVNNTAADMSITDAAHPRRSTESMDTRPSCDRSYGRPSIHEDDYQLIMQRRKKAYEALFAGDGPTDHFLNEELAARSSLFNSGN